MSINTVASFSPTSIAVGLLLDALAAGDIYDQVTLPGLPNAIRVPERDAVIAATTAPAPLFGGELEAIATEHHLDVILLRIGDLEHGSAKITADFALGSLTCAVWAEQGFSLYQDADGTWLVPAGFGPAVAVTWEGFNLENRAALHRSDRARRRHRARRPQPRPLLPAGGGVSVPKPFQINANVQPDPANPHSWLPLIGHPPGESGPGGVRVMWGVLRPEYRSFSPSLSTFVRMKLAPAAGANAAPWAITAYRHEVLLPAFASDHLRDPRTLIEAAEHEQPVDTKALAAYVTLTSSPDRLHAAWEIGRTLAKNLVDDYDVAALLVQHVPLLAGGSAQPHLHLIIPGPRRVTRYGMFSTIVGDLAGDRGRDLVLTLLAGIVGEAGA